MPVYIEQRLLKRMSIGGDDQQETDRDQRFPGSQADAKQQSGGQFEHRYAAIMRGLPAWYCA